MAGTGAAARGAARARAGTPAVSRAAATCARASDRWVGDFISTTESERGSKKAVLFLARLLGVCSQAVFLLGPLIRSAGAEQTLSDTTCTPSLTRDGRTNRRGRG